MLSLGGFAFASPWLLAGFVIVPALWWLLRVTPPAPTIVRFPAIRLLLGLVPPEETPARTPLWLILLRMLLAALLILALAHPIVNPTAALPGGGPLLLVVDDGWAAATDWPARQRVMTELIDRAEREGRQVVLLPTAPNGAVDPLSLVRPADARGQAQALRPKPWPTDRAVALKRLDSVDLHGGASVYWLSDGLDDKGGAQALGEKLRGIGAVHFLAPPAVQTARLVALGPDTARDLTVTVKRAAQGEAPPVRLRASGEDGRMLAQAEGRFPEDRGSVDVAFKMPTELRNRVARIDIEGETTAGSTLLIDEESRRRPVGIASDRPTGSAQPLLSDTYYVERAVEPFAELRRGAAGELIKRGLSLLVLPDGDAGSGDERNALKKWIDAGGVMVRFAGPLMAEAQKDDLLPVTLRHGGRTIGGAMSWEKPAHLAPFPAESPFAGLEVPSDVTVARQVLAEPSVDLGAKTWMRLSDGTPLVTAEKRGKGWLVLIHTSANTAWSNLPLSGLFVDMLRRLVQLGQGQAGAAEGVLPPWQIMDGFGRLAAPPPTAQPAAGSALAKLPVGPSHPPGFYGTEESHRALNLSGSVTGLAPITDLPAGLSREGYVKAPELDLRPGLLGAALLLALIDLVIGYGLRGLLHVERRVGVAILLGIALASAQAMAADAPNTSGADPADRYTIEATRDLRLAYVRTGDAEADSVSRAGLQGLGTVLARRTAVETGDPMEVDVENDELIFFPLIYWPVTNAQKPLSPQAVERVNRYLATGGTILFDARDEGQATGGANDAADRLSQLLAGVKIPPLVQIPPDHVLTKSFYLMQDFPGRWDGSVLWVEPAEDRVNDGVSTVIYGANDWAAAWAVDGQGFPSYAVVPGGEAQREQAFRFGINLVMYALTGNYKADQVHVPAILERLGQ
ncbi:MAG TPA: DUF4159 domain-containing protein [Aliidongia sp.]|nr:DUF4159 domain-containing protein [Aliidongia sp.]